MSVGIYGGYIQAVSLKKERDGSEKRIYTLHPIVVRAHDFSEAIALALRTSHMRYPESDGYCEHDADMTYSGYDV